MKGRERNNYYIDVKELKGAFKEKIQKAIQIGFKWLLEKIPEKGKGLIVVPTKNQLKLSDISTVFPENMIKGLLKSNKFITKDGYKFHLMTDRIDIIRFDGPVLAIFPMPSLIDKIDNVYELKDVFIIPWGENDIMNWLDTWSPTEYLTGKQYRSTLAISSEIADELESLTLGVNLSTGISHPSDRREAIRLFQRLKSSNIEYDPRSVKLWLIKKGWKTKHAEDVKKVAQMIKEGKRPRY
ncbi:MAG: hypothetical protein ACFFB5_20905 [Promethearchaeota archaeon]